jgi:hypothetical protein
VFHAQQAVAFAATAKACFAIVTTVRRAHRRGPGPSGSIKKSNVRRNFNMRHAFQGIALVVAVGAQVLTFYSVLFA